MHYLKHLSLMLTALWGPEMLAADHGQTGACRNEIAASSQPDMLVGIGEAGSYQDAKNAAIADAISFLGTTISARSSVVDAGPSSDTYADASVESETNAIVMGAKVLSDCPEGGQRKIVVGIAKTLIAKVIEAHAEQRKNLIQSAVNELTTKPTAKTLRDSKKKYDEILAEEKKDLDNWLVLGRARETFKEIPMTLRKDLEDKLAVKPGTEVTMSVISKDSIAEQTISILINKLSSDGVVVAKAINKDDAAVWSCSLLKGSPIGSTIRFRVQCSLLHTTYQFSPIIVNGMASNSKEEIDNTAVRLVSQELMMAH